MGAKLTDGVLLVNLFCMADSQIVFFSRSGNDRLQIGLGLPGGTAGQRTEKARAYTQQAGGPAEEQDTDTRHYLLFVEHPLFIPWVKAAISNMC